MKKHSVINALAILTLSSAMLMSLFTGCEGPQGIAGVDGVDANENCTQCHNSGSDLVAKISQAAHSKHQTGYTSFETRTSCAPCHTSQGFIERIANGAQVTAAEIENPAAVNCRTCHMIHEKYDSTDFALRGSEPVTLWLGGTTLDLGTSNTCVQCHQARIVSPMPVLAGADIAITSSRWGVHHGPQSAVLAGLVGYKVAGATDYPTGNHAHKAGGCVSCHMSKAIGSLAGGHSFNMESEEEGENLASCVACHAEATSFDIDGSQTEVAELLEQLKTILIDKGYLNASTGLWKATTAAPLNLTADQAGTLLNYNLISEDRSLGVHNPSYVKALLKNSVDFWELGL